MDNLNNEPVSKQVAAAMVAGQRRFDWVRSYVDIATACGDPESSTLNPNQIFTLLDHHQYQVAEKGRQEGHSFGFSLDSVAGSVIEPRSRHVHISTDKWEAQNKQVYCLNILDSLHRDTRQYARIKTESKERIEFANGAMIDFLACRPPRGVPRARIYLDEIAFMPNVLAILKASIAATLHGGYIRAGSTHFGVGTEFYQMVRNTANEAGRKPYDPWHRGYFPWWTCPNLCVDVNRAIYEAPGMATEERVEKFGNYKLKMVFSGYALVEDFQEEMECIACDLLHSFYPISLIQSCHPLNPDSYWFEYVECSSADVDPLEPAKNAIRLLAREIKSNKMNGQWYWAMDIGHTHDKDEITIGNLDKKVLSPRVMISMSRMPFEKKEELIHYMMEQLPIQLGLIDSTGMGTQLGQNMNARYGEKAAPLVFDNNNKGIMANDLKIMMEGSSIMIPILSSLVRQIHAIKKTVTRHKREVYDVEENREHHGDKFWSLAMFASMAALTPAKFSFPIIVTNTSQLHSIPSVHSYKRGSIGQTYHPHGIIIKSNQN